MFNKVMDSCTENYECLVLDNTSKSNRIEDCVFWYKATLRKNFKVGAPQYWQTHKKMFNPRHGNMKIGDRNTVKKTTPLKVIKKK